MPSIDAPWNRPRAAAVAAAAVRGDWHTRKADLQPRSAASPWNQPGYTSPKDFMQVTRPLRCQPLSANMPKECPPYPYSTLLAYHWQELSRAMNKALRHDRELPVNQRGYAKISDLAWVLGTGYYRLIQKPTWQTYFQSSTTRIKIASRRCLHRSSLATTFYACVASKATAEDWPHTQIKRLEQCSTMCHYTHSDILMQIIRPDPVSHPHL